MITGRITVDYGGFDYLLKGSAIYKAIRIGANRAAAKVKTRLVANAPRQFGYLKKSSRIKVTLRKKPSSDVLVRVGPGSKLKFKKGKYKKNTKKHKKGESIIHRPARYAHLAERYHHHTRRTHDESVVQFFAEIQKEITGEIAKAERQVKA